MAGESTSVLDGFYLSATFLISLALQGTLFLISFSFQTDKLTDLGGSANFLVLALFTLFAGAAATFQTRNLIASIFVVIWSLRLGGFLLFRVLKTGKDGRFDEMRPHFFRFMAFWVFQLMWCWTVSLPLTILNSPNVSDPVGNYRRIKFGTAADILGMIMFILGFVCEAIADQQKYNYKSNKPPRGSINDKGVWHYTRHPNFFGEIFLWWGIWVLCLSPAIYSRGASPSARAALFGSIVGPIFISLLLFFISGLPLAEKPTAEKYFLMTHGTNPESGDKWAEYQAYLRRTSILFPIPPAIYRRIPEVVKRTVLLDLPMFQFDEHKDGPAALEKEKNKAATTA